MNKELERIIAEQCLYIYLRGKAIAIGAVRSHPFTSECPLILVVISRVLAVRHKSHNISPLTLRLLMSCIYIYIYIYIYDISRLRVKYTGITFSSH